MKGVIVRERWSKWNSVWEKEGLVVSVKCSGLVCTTRWYAITSKVVSDFESKRSNFACMGRKSGSFSK